jgi:predicted  nucleic acid-binding Zn-ribbon protein
MSEIKTLLRYCPSCGKRFHIRLVSKKLADAREVRTQVESRIGEIGGRGSGVRYAVSQPLLVEENVPVTIDLEDFEYTYKCKQCGHTWTEVREEESME